jgi:KDO transferase-3
VPRLEERGGQRWLVASDLEVCLQDFADSHARFSGPVFLLASGPSASEFPLQDYRRFPVVAMNGSIVRCVEDGVTPFYYLCDDPNFVVGRPELALLGVRHSEHLAMSLDVLQAIYAADPLALRDKKIYMLERVNRGDGRHVMSDRAYAWSIRHEKELVSNFSLLRRKPNRIGFSLNLKRGYFGSRTIPFGGLQLVCHLGFRQVFVVGMDLRQGGGRFYEKGAAALPSSIDEDFEQYILPSFVLMARKIVPRTGLQVFNMSAVSRMPESVIPKISLQTLDQMLTGDPAVATGTASSGEQ